jgi:hypothetical protein
MSYDDFVTALNFNYYADLAGLTTRNDVIGIQKLNDKLTKYKEYILDYAKENPGKKLTEEKLLIQGYDNWADYNVRRAIVGLMPNETYGKIQTHGPLINVTMRTMAYISMIIFFIIVWLAGMLNVFLVVGMVISLIIIALGWITMGAMAALYSTKPYWQSIKMGPFAMLEYTK